MQRSQQQLSTGSTIDYRCEDRKKVGELKCDGGVFQKTPMITPKEWTVQPGHAFKDTAFKPLFKNVKLQTRLYIVTLLLFFWNRYHQWLPDIELVQNCAFFKIASDSRINPRFTVGKHIGGLRLSRNSRTPENNHLHIYSLWVAHGLSTARINTRNRASGRSFFFLFFFF